jgi:hypothetical protein
MPDETQQVETTETTTTTETVDSNQDFDKERAMATIQNLRKFEQEAKKAQRRLRELEEAEEARKQAELSETDRLKAEADKARQEAEGLQKQLQQTRIRHAVELEAARLAFHDPDVAYSLADLSSVEIDEAGKVTGVKEALAALSKARPYLIKTEEATGRVPGDPANSSNGRRLDSEQKEEARKAQADFARSRF